MILLPYALLLLVLCTGAVARPGRKEGRERDGVGDRREDHTSPKPYAITPKSPKPQAAAEPTNSHAVAVSSNPQSLSSMTVDQIFLRNLVPLEELDKLKITNELPSTLWPPKIGGIYYTEPQNFGRPRSRKEHGSRSIHPVIVMPVSAEHIIKTNVECVVILEISHNLKVDEKYQLDVKSLIQAKPGEKELTGMVNVGAYRIVEMNKFVLVPPTTETLRVLPEDEVKTLENRVNNVKDFPRGEKFYPKWVLAKEEDKLKLKTSDTKPLISTKAPWRRDLMMFLMKKPAA